MDIAIQTMIGLGAYLAIGMIVAARCYRDAPEEWEATAERQGSLRSTWIIVLLWLPLSGLVLVEWLTRRKTS